MIKKLLLVEWEDSARPLSEWRYIDDAPSMEIIRCLSVGWVISENKQLLMLAPNIGNVDSESEQACGFMRIPKKSITSIKVLEKKV